MRLAGSAGFDGNNVCVEPMTLALRLEVVFERHLIADLLNAEGAGMVTANDVDEMCDDFERVTALAPAFEDDCVAVFGRSDSDDSVPIATGLVSVPNVDSGRYVEVTELNDFIDLALTTEQHYRLLICAPTSELQILYVEVLQLNVPR